MFKYSTSEIKRGTREIKNSLMIFQFCMYFLRISLFYSQISTTMHFFFHSMRICKKIYSSTLYAAVYKVLISTYTGYACCSANRDITYKLNFIVNDIFCCYRQQSVAVTASIKKKEIYQTNTWPHIRIWR